MSNREQSSQFGGSDVVLLGRIRDMVGKDATRASFSEITLSVFGGEKPDNVVATAVPLSPIATYVYDVPQLEEATWKIDTVGYNFRYVVDPAYLPCGHRQHRFDVRFAYVGGGATHAMWSIPNDDDTLLSPPGTIPPGQDARRLCVFWPIAG